MVFVRTCLWYLILLSQYCTDSSDAVFIPLNSIRFHNEDSIASRRIPFIVQSPTTHSYTSSSPTALQQRSSKDWDAILNDGDDDKNSSKEETELPVPPDIKYIPRNYHRLNQNFMAIYEAGGPINDIYMRDPDTSIFWFVGKTARVSDVSLQQAVSRLWPMVEKHATNLRPLELYPAAGRLELWTAPGDSEIQVAYNRPNIVFEKMERVAIDPRLVKIDLVGFRGEEYVMGEEGFRTVRLEDGRPALPEVQSPASIIDKGDDDDENDVSTRAPSAEEMEEILKAFQGKDINAIYEEQERRKREGE